MVGWASGRFGAGGSDFGVPAGAGATVGFLTEESLTAGFLTDEGATAGAGRAAGAGAAPAAGPPGTFTPGREPEVTACSSRTTSSVLGNRFSGCFWSIRSRTRTSCGGVSGAN